MSSGNDVGQTANNTINSLLQGVQTAYGAGPTYVAPGKTTTDAQAASLAAANGDPNYGNAVDYGNYYLNSIVSNNGLTGGQASDVAGVQGLANQYGTLAANATNTQANGYDTLRNALSNDVLTKTNSSFNNSGLFGSDSNQYAAASGLTDALGALDYQQYQDAINNQKDYLAAQSGAYTSASGLEQQGYNNVANAGTALANNFAAGQLPSATSTAVGAAQDASAQASANQNIDLLGQLFGLTNGSTGDVTASNTDIWSILSGLLTAAA